MAVTKVTTRSKAKNNAKRNKKNNLSASVATMTTTTNAATSSNKSKSNKIKKQQQSDFSFRNDLKLILKSIFQPKFATIISKEMKLKKTKPSTDSSISTSSPVLLSEDNPNMANQILYTFDTNHYSPYSLSQFYQNQGEQDQLQLSDDRQQESK